jgi:hypothetical protein
MKYWLRIRQITALICTPVVGLLAARLVSVMEALLRSKPPVEDDAALFAQAIVGPLVIPAFLIFCAFYILPVSWFLRRFNVFLSAAIITLPIWILSSVVLNAPQLGERVWETAVFLTGPALALPIMASALVARAAWMPNKALQATAATPGI